MDRLTVIHFVVSFLCVINLFCTANGCTYLTAVSSTSTFDSHSFYNVFSYNSYIDDCWIITTDNSDMIVKIESISFDLEYHSSCSYDYLKLYDSDSASGDSSTYCGTDGFTIYSSGSSMYLQFHTDGSVPGDGFRLRYSQVDASNYNSALWTTDNSAAIALIIGIVVGVIALIIIVVIVVIVILVVCVFASSNSRGRVVPHNRGHVVNQNGHVSYINPAARPGVVMVQPPPYAQSGQHPPGYNTQTVRSHGGQFMAVQQQQAPPPGYQMNTMNNGGMAMQQQSPPPAYQGTPMTGTAFNSVQTQQNNLDANGVPGPAIYNDPA